MASAPELALKLSVTGDTSKLSDVHSDLDKIDQKAGPIPNKLGGIATGLGAFVGGGIAVAGVATAFKSFFDAAQESNRVAAQTESVIKSTGGAAGLTAEQVGNLAEKLSAKSLFDDETIQSAENLLLTFTNIGQDVFPGATQAVIDMSQAMGQDLQSSATQIGKALNDPIAGIGALSRVGVQFTADQKAMIEGMVEAGDTAGAQAIIMAELEKQFGGSAEAAFAAAGPTAELSKKWEEMQEIIGQKLIPIVNTLAGLFIGAIDFMAPFIEAIANSQPALIGLAAALTTLVVPALVIMAAAAWAAIAPLLPFIAAAVAVGVAVAALYAAWQSNFLGIRDITMAVIGFVQPYIETAIGATKTLFETVWPLISAAVDIAMQAISLYVTTYLGIVQSVASTILGAVQAIFETVWPIISAVVDVAMQAINTYVSTYIAAVQLVVETFIGAINTIWGPFWDGLKTAVDTVLGVGGGVVIVVTDGLQAVYDAIAGKLAAIRDNIWNPIWNGLRDTAQGVVDYVTGIWDRFAGIFNSIPDIKIGGGSFMGVDIPELTIGFPDLPIIDGSGGNGASGLGALGGGGGGGGQHTPGNTTGGGQHGGGGTDASANGGGYVDPLYGLGNIGSGGIGNSGMAKISIAPADMGTLADTIARAVEAAVERGIRRALAGAI